MIRIIGLDDASLPAVAPRLPDITLDGRDPSPDLHTPILILLHPGMPAASLRNRLAVVRDAKVRCEVVNPDRYLPSRQLIRQQLDAGKLGEPGLIRMHRWEPGEAVDSPLLADLDLALWYFGKSPSHVYAVKQSSVTQIHLGFPGGGMALLDHVCGLAATEPYRSLSVIGSTGAAYADDHQNKQLLIHGGLHQAIGSGEGAGYLIKLIQTVADGMLHEKLLPESYPLIDDLLAVHDAVGESMRTNQAVNLSGASRRLT